MIARGWSLVAFAVLCLVIAGCSPIADSQTGPTPTPPANSETSAALQAVRDAVNARGTVFGGAYLDLAGTTLTVLVAGADEATVDEIQQLIPGGAHVVWLPVRFSLAELQRTSDEIVSTWQLVGVQHISSVSLDMPNNRVLVAFPIANPQLEAQFRAKYGNAVGFAIEPAGEPL